MDTIQPNQEHLLQWELNKSETECQMLKMELEKKDAEVKEMTHIQRQLIRAGGLKPDKPQGTQTLISRQTSEEHAKDRHIRDLENTLRSKRQDNELLQAQVDESEYWIYDRGPIAEELKELRANSVAKDMEIQRLTRENTRVMESLRRAESVVSGAGRKHVTHEIGHPPADRSSITQTFVNNLWDRSKQAKQQNNPSNK